MAMNPNANTEIGDVVELKRGGQYKLTTYGDLSAIEKSAYYNKNDNSVIPAVDGIWAWRARSQPRKKVWLRVS